MFRKVLGLGIKRFFSWSFRLVGKESFFFGCLFFYVRGEFVSIIFFCYVRGWKILGLGYFFLLVGGGYKCFMVFFFSFEVSN